MNVSDTPTEGLHVSVVVLAPFRERLPEFVIIAAISLLAFVGNLSLWIIVLRDRQLRTVSNWLVLGLSAADLFVSTVNMPFIMFNLWMGQWVLAEWSCMTLGFFSMVAFISSVLSLASISWNRYMFICRPNRCKSVYTKGKTLAMIAGIWLTAAILAMPPLLGWGRYAYIPTQSICFCEWKTSVSYTFFMVGVCFGGPCSVMAFCYVKILQEVRASKRRLQNNKPIKAMAQPVNAAIGSTSSVGNKSVTQVGRSYTEEDEQTDNAKTKRTLIVQSPGCLSTTKMVDSQIELSPPSVASLPSSSIDCRDRNRALPSRAEAT
ncbi:hypothetical protein LSH36_76g02002 [Paralvinella palmiformis]|uniref:G-protein coupled receptors family 1 profile domain-containing protein n=1 Tax=Paralvinella palmiformis TaxID=53620 RepID=A0AAD9K2C2_9ANNE|nr:hypothetical protein LSH36_76g02002 [Paralvinella palmiformis]